MAAERGARGDRRGFTPLNVVGSAPSAMGAATPEPAPAESGRAAGGELAEVAALGERVGQLIDSLGSSADPAVGDQVDELLDAIDQLHREALRRLAGLLDHHDLLEHACVDPLIGAVFDLYDLRPGGSPEAPVSPQGAPPSTPDAGPPGLIPLNVSTPAPTAPPGLIPLNAGSPSPRSTPARTASPSSPLVPARAPATDGEGSAPGVAAKAAQTVGEGSAAGLAAKPAQGEMEWFDVCALEDVPPGSMHAPDEGALLLANVGGEVVAYRNGCGNGPLALHMGRMSDETHLVCPWHIGCVYDLTTGVSGEPPAQLTLIRYPVRLEDGRILVAFDSGAEPAAHSPVPTASAEA